MKTPNDPRHKKRQELIQELFRIDFHNQRISPAAKEIYNHKDLIDTKIYEAAPDFPVEKINKVDLAILRLAVYELCIARNAPPNVVIDEAVELAKEFSGDTSPAFINGALGKLVVYEKHSKNTK